LGFLDPPPRSTSPEQLRIRSTSTSME
jgi:hypothetical protein